MLGPWAAHQGKPPPLPPWSWYFFPKVPLGCWLKEEHPGFPEEAKEISLCAVGGKGIADGRRTIGTGGLRCFSPKSVDEVIKVHLGKECLFFFILFSLNFFLVFQITHTWHRKFGRYTHMAFIKYELDKGGNEAWGGMTYRPITLRSLFISL